MVWLCFTDSYGAVIQTDLQPLKIFMVWFHLKLHHFYMTVCYDLVQEIVWTACFIIETKKDLYTDQSLQILVHQNKTVIHFQRKCQLDNKPDWINKWKSKFHSGIDQYTYFNARFTLQSISGFLWLPFKLLSGL